MKYLAFQLVFFLFACQPVPKKSNKVEAMNKLLLHLDKDTFTHFEPIRPGVQIINSSKRDIKIQFVNMNWEEFSFSDPCLVHLIGADGQDYASIYERPQSYFEEIEPIIVPAKREEWFYFPLNVYFPQLEKGNYKLWLDLKDAKGDTMISNVVSFEVVLPNFAFKTNDVNIAISMVETEIEQVENLKVNVKFTNNYAGSLTFLKPNFDSFYGWTNPTYFFVVKERASGRVIPLALRSGSMETPIYDDTSMFSLNHEEQKNMNITLPDYPKLSQPGEYTIQLYYLLREKQIGKSGTILNKEMNWGEDVFVGLIESNIINLNVINK